MSQDLVVQLHADGGLRWSIIDRRLNARLRDGEAAAGDMPDFGTLDGIDRSICLLPSEEVFAARVRLPARSDREARQAAPFMIEDELATRLDETEITLGPKGEEGARWVCAVDRQWLAGWREALADNLPRPAHVLPDCLALAGEDAALSLCRRGDAVVFLSGDAQAADGQAAGGAADADMFDRILPDLVSAAGEGEIAVSASLGLTGANLRVLDNDDLDLRASAMEDEALKVFPALFGEHILSTFDWGAVLKPVKRLGALAAGTLLVFGLLYGGEAMYFRYQADRFEQSSLALFQSEFSDVSARLSIPMARRILDQRLAGAGGGDRSVSFLQLAAALAELTESHDSVRIDHMRYDRTRGELSVSALYSEFADFDALSLRAEQLGVELEDQGTRESDAGIEGDFVLRLR